MQTPLRHAGSSPHTDARRTALLAALDAHTPADALEAESHARIRTFVRHTPEPFARTTHAGHVTGSALVASAHDIPARGTEPAHVHYDIRYLLRTRTGTVVPDAQEPAGARWLTIEEAAGEVLDVALRRALGKAAALLANDPRPA